MAPPQTPRNLRGRVLQQLCGAGTWVGRPALSRLTTCAAALDDVLADLVMEGLASYQEGHGYRLRGSVAMRRAAAQLVTAPPEVWRQVVMVDVGLEVDVGVAERRPDEGMDLLLYGLRLPPAANDAAALARSAALAAMCSKEAGKK